MPYFTSNGCNLYVDHAGSGTPLLFVHGFTLDHRQWDFEFRSFARHFAVFRMDLRSHGKSGRAEMGHTFVGRATDVKRCMVQIGMDRKNPGFLVGHSVAADACLQASLDEPRAVVGVVLMAPVVWGQEWSLAWRQRMRGMRSAAVAGETTRVLEFFRDDPIFAGVRANPDLLRRVMAMQEAFGIEPLLSDEGNEGTPTLERLPTSKVPTLVLHGTKDIADFHDAATAVAERTPGARLVNVGNAGHFINLEEPQRVQNLLHEYLHNVVASQQ